MVLNIKYRQLKAFLLLEETGSFKSAAERLAVTQPSLSVLIKELENDLGLTLIERSTRSAQLTDAGRALCDQIRGSIVQIERAYLAAKATGNVKQGRLRVATLPIYASGILVPWVTKFSKLHPGINIEIIERTYTNFLQAIKQREVDVGIGVLRTQEPDLDFELLFEDRLAVVAPPKHPVTQSRNVLKALPECNLIMVSSSASRDAWDSLAQFGARPALLVEQTSTGIALARQGMGVTLASTGGLAGVDIRGLKSVPIPGPTYVRRVGLIRLESALPSPAAKAFMDLAREQTQSLKFPAGEH